MLLGTCIQVPGFLEKVPGFQKRFQVPEKQHRTFIPDPMRLSFLGSGIKVPEKVPGL